MTMAEVRNVASNMRWGTPSTSRMQVHGIGTIETWVYDRGRSLVTVTFTNGCVTLIWDF